MSASREARGRCSIAAFWACGRSSAARSQRSALHAASSTGSDFSFPNSSKRSYPQATIEAESRGLTLSVMPVDSGVVDRGETARSLRPLLANLLQNAFKFTRPGTDRHASRRARAPERVLIEVQDECGGLRLERSTNCSARSSSAAPTEPAWASAWRSAGGAPKRTTAGSTRAICRSGMRLHTRSARIAGPSVVTINH